MKESGPFISNFKPGDNIKGFFICRDMRSKITRLGDPYLDLFLEDQTGIIRAKVWSYVDSLNKLIKIGQPVAVKGEIIQFNDTNEINVSYINTVKNDLYNIYGFNKNNLIQTINHDVDKLFASLNKIIRELDLPYRKILKLIINNKSIFFKKIPTLDIPFNISGGYLLEIMTILKINHKIFPLYKNLDKNLVISGIILKKIGLLNYFNDDYLFTKKECNEKIDINLLGLDIIFKFFNDKKIDEIKNKIQRIIINDSKDSNVNVKYVNALYLFNKHMPL